MTLNDAGEQFQINFPLSTSNAWQKRDTSQDRDRRARCNKGHRTLNQGNMDVGPGTPGQAAPTLCGAPVVTTRMEGGKDNA